MLTPAAIPAAAAAASRAIPVVARAAMRPPVALKPVARAAGRTEDMASAASAIPWDKLQQAAELMMRAIEAFVRAIIRLLRRILGRDDPQEKKDAQTQQANNQTAQNFVDSQQLVSGKQSAFPGFAGTHDPDGAQRSRHAGDPKDAVDVEARSHFRHEAEAKQASSFDAGDALDLVQGAFALDRMMEALKDDEEIDRARAQQAGLPAAVLDRAVALQQMMRDGADVLLPALLHQARQGLDVVSAQRWGELARDLAASLAKQRSNVAFEMEKVGEVWRERHPDKSLEDIARSLSPGDTSDEARLLRQMVGVALKAAVLREAVLVSLAQTALAEVASGQIDLDALRREAPLLFEGLPATDKIGPMIEALDARLLKAQQRSLEADAMLRLAGLEPKMVAYDLKHDVLQRASIPLPPHGAESAQELQQRRQRQQQAEAAARTQGEAHQRQEPFERPGA